MIRFARRATCFVILFGLTALVGACGSDPQSGGVRVVSPDDAYDVVFEDQPEQLIVLDVRTPEEYSGQRLPDARLIDFYEPDFADRIAELDRNATYVLYCRSGNRSGSTRDLMQELGFTDVRDIDGGILAWLEAGLPFVTSNG